MQHDIFLKSPYLKALEQTTPSNIISFYVGIFKNETLVGIAYVQRVQLYLNDMFRDTKATCVQDIIKNMLSKVLQGNILVIGNLMHTGQHGISFNEKEIDFSSFLSEVYKALTEIKTLIKKETGKTIRMFVFKDYFKGDAITLETSFFKSKKLHKVLVQPNMIMETNPNWTSFSDYGAALNKKYRDRFKRAKKKFNGIVKQELDLGEVEKNSNTLHNLYLTVSQNAKFNTFILPENHFFTLKQNLNDNFKVFGYFLNGELIGFYTLILNGQNLETYFLGYNETQQYQNQLYLNMLYDMAQFGIDNNFKNIVYARTAMEIKSSVGAKAFSMVVYLKHTNIFVNAILQSVFRFMSPKQDWVERSPFIGIRRKI